VSRRSDPGGEPEPLGVTPRGSGVNVAVNSANADAIELCLFDGERESRRIRLRGRTGEVFHDWVPDVPIGARYGLRAHGPYRPNQGHYFNPAKLLIDPYALMIDRPFRLHRSMFGYRSEEGDRPGPIDEVDSAPFVPKAIVRDLSPGGPGTRIASWSRTVLYELHTRGFSIRHPRIPEALRGRFGALANPFVIEHLSSLGVTTIEIMPVAAWIDERHLVSLGLRNYWGYNPIAMMAPEPTLAPGGWTEIRETVTALARAGIEVILDVVLNHSGEGDALGPTISLRGLDNATYYRAKPGDVFNYANDTGCGNTLALNRPVPMRLAMDTLRTWANQAGVHGFRFDLAATMGRGDDGFDPAAPLLSAIAQDPILRDLKLIAEPWDVGPGGYRVGAFPAGWGEWNDRFRDDVRRFWRGDPGAMAQLATRLAGSSDLFLKKAVVSRSVNFVVAHDGFTLADLVSFEQKHNFANGERNQDGTNTNFSWNNGVEGQSSVPAIDAARRRDQRALLATLILARGTPMLAMGAELGHSQDGNNNAYSQDNPTTWLDWDKADARLLAWSRHLLRIRRNHAVLRDDRFLTGEAFDSSLLPDVDWRGVDGQRMTPEAWNAADSTTLVVTLAGPGDAADSTDRVSVIFHRGQNEISATIPPPRDGYAWHMIADSSDESDDFAERPIPNVAIKVLPRSVLVLAERPTGQNKTMRADAGVLDRLARAAGIAPEWWDVAGHHTQVSDDSRRALLASMRLPAVTDAEARTSLRYLSEELDRRALPYAITAHRGEAAILNISVGPGSFRSTWLTIQQEDGEATQVRLTADDATIETFTSVDGLPARSLRVSLPMLPEGRHRLWREDAPNTVCQLTVAPARCFLPIQIRDGGKFFGISTQLYSLRRRDNMGIGDFTTLAELAEASARERAAIVGLNPVHMLFPEQRVRASPYYPSDRRFIDPIYLDAGIALASSEQSEQESRQAASSELADYPAVWASKRSMLEHRFAAFTDSCHGDPTSDPAFRQYIDTGGVDLWRFAAFQTVAETRPGEDWRQWPESLRLPDSKDVAAFASAHIGRMKFHQFLQFLADQQFGHAAKRASEAGLLFGFYRDLAVGAAPDGSEAWCRSDELADRAWIGAPPDPFAADGQNWHLPPTIPYRLRQNYFQSFRALIAANMRHAGALRIDHAMGLARLFWIPDGGMARDGAYVAYPLKQLMAELALESARARCMVVAEDLGTVPEGFRDAIVAADVFSYRVVLLERDGDRFKPSSTYPKRSVACVTTHDLPPVAGWWSGADVAERRSLGQIATDSDADGRRAKERAALVELLTNEGQLESSSSRNPTAASIVAAVHAFAARASSDLMLVQAEDLGGMTVGVNLPGTDTERPNWRLRLPEPVETLLTGPTARTILDAVRSSGRGTDAVAGPLNAEDRDPNM
jgi:glycogen operon protein